MFIVLLEPPRFICVRAIFIADKVVKMFMFRGFPRIRRDFQSDHNSFLLIHKFMSTFIGRARFGSTFRSNR